MISISFTPDSAHWFTFVGEVSLPYLSGDQSTGFWDIGSFCLITDPDFSDPLVRVVDARFGYLIQGKREWGALHDTDVFHLNAKGTLFVNELFSSGRVATNEDPYNYYTGTYVKDSPTSERLAIAAVPWGIDVEIPMSMTVPKVYASHSWRDSYKWYATHSIRFDGDWAILTTCQAADPYKMYAADNLPVSDDNPVEMLLSPTSTCQVQWFRRNPPNRAPGIYASPVIYGHGSTNSQPGVLFDTINRKSVSVEHLTPNALDSLPSDPCNQLVFERSLITQGSEQDSYRRAIECKHRIEDGALIQYVMQNFNVPIPQQDFGELGQDILKAQMHANSSILLTAIDLAMIADDVQSWMNLANYVRSFADKGADIVLKAILAIKAGSDAYLSTIYGIMPTYSDIKRVTDGIVKIINHDYRTPTRQHSRRASKQEGLLDTPVNTQLTLTCEVSQLPRGAIGDSMVGIYELHKWGLYPTSAMLWDAIPFSFCIDWFIDLGNAAKTFDNNIWTMYFPIQYCIQSQKRTWSPPVERLWPDLGVTGEIAFSYYDRYTSTVLPLPPIQTGEKSGPFTHWAEGTALVVQRML